MTHENHSAFASTDSHPAPEPRNIKDRARTLRQNVRELCETLDGVDESLKEAAGKTKSAH